MAPQKSRVSERRAYKATVLVTCFGRVLFYVCKCPDSLMFLGDNYCHLESVEVTFFVTLRMR